MYVIERSMVSRGGWMRSNEIILFITEYDVVFNTLNTVRSVKYE